MTLETSLENPSRHEIFAVATSPLGLSFREKIFFCVVRSNPDVFNPFSSLVVNSM